MEVYVKPLGATAVGAVAALLLLAIIGATPAPAASCKGMIFGEPASGRVFQRLLVEPKAKRAWSAKVRARYGLAYSSSMLAQNKNIICYRGTPDRRWHCKASGRPCRA